MSTTMFVEATSADPFVRDLHRKAVRMLNDPLLDRKQREFHMRKLQNILIEHQAKQAAKANMLAAKTVRREKVSLANHDQQASKPEPVVAHREECGAPEKKQDAGVEKVVVTAGATDNGQVAGRRRPVLSLKRA